MVQTTDQTSTRPHIERTHFDPIEPPRAVKLYYCPACGKRITKDYGVEPARKSCTTRWHLTAAVEVEYLRKDVVG